jgi:hypothetical protein
MPEAAEKYAFEKFPRRPLVSGVTRRRLWSALTTEFLVYSGKGRGGTACKLADLGELPDEQLAEVVPEVVPGCEIAVRGGFAWGRPPLAGRPIELFPLDSPALTAFNLFNGLTPLGEAGVRLAQASGWDEARSFAYVRGLFLCLVMAGICRPGG